MNHISQLHLLRHHVHPIPRRQEYSLRVDHNETIGCGHSHEVARTLPGHGLTMGSPEALSTLAGKNAVNPPLS